MIQIERVAVNDIHAIGQSRSASLAPTESMSTDSNCHPMDHESALDVAEPQSLTDDPLMLHGNGHSRTLVPTDSKI